MVTKKTKGSIGTAVIAAIVIIYVYGKQWVQQHPVWSVLIAFVLLAGIVLATYYAIKRPEIREKEIGFFKFLWEALAAATSEGKERKKRKAISTDTKEYIYKRANDRCQKCGGKGRHVHHIDGNPSNNSKNNLILLCPNCHDESHRGFPKDVLRRYAKGSKHKTHTHKYKD